MSELCHLPDDCVSGHPAANPSGDQSIVKCFAAQVIRCRDSTAVQDEAGSVTYASLDRYANRVANALLAQPCTPGESPVCLLCTPGAALLAAILGTLKTGRPYLPLDPNQPVSRQNAIIANSGAHVLLCDSAHIARARELAGESIALIEVDRLDGVFPEHDPRIDVAPGAPAYILYTSGSTGAPKGVQVSHRLVMHNALSLINSFGLQPTERCASILSPAYGLTNSMVFQVLLSGGVMLPFDLRQKGLRALASWLRRERINLVRATPSVIRRLLDALEPDEAFPELRYVWFGGEPLYRDDLERWWPRMAQDGRIIHGFSSTEVKNVSQLVVERDTRLDDGLVSVGHPIESKRVYILDEAGREVSPGEIGELWVQSRYLADGYWRDPELSRERFLAAPDAPGERVFRTGDLGRFRPDGTLELCGRRDLQVKIRGFRVQPEEAESALCRVAGVREAAVVAEGSGGERRLMAYVVSEGAALDIGAIRADLAELLPEYLMPSRIVEVSVLPLSASGKVDRGALAELDVKGAVGPQSLPRSLSDVEKVLLRGARDLLQGAQIGLDDDFMASGGDSLVAAALLVWTEQVFHVDVSLGEFLAQPTLGALAARIDALRASATAAGSKPHKLVIPLAPGTEGVPIFLAPGGGGGEVELFLAYTDLVRELGHRHPVYGLRPSSPDKQSNAGATVEEMAQAFVPAIRAIQPQGPYVLLGECYGGLLALDLAQRLSQEGDAAIPLLLDTLAPTHRTGLWRPLRKIQRRMQKLVRRGWQRVRHHWSEAKRHQGGGWLAYLIKRLRAAPQLVAETWSPGQRSREPGLTQRIEESRQEYKQALFKYRPRPFAGPLALILNEAYARRGHASPWRRYVRGDLRIRTAPGDHRSAVRAHAPETVQVIFECLDELVGATQRE